MIIVVIMIKLIIKTIIVLILINNVKSSDDNNNNYRSNNDNNEHFKRKKVKRMIFQTKFSPKNALFSYCGHDISKSIHSRALKFCMLRDLNHAYGMNQDY